MDSSSTFVRTCYRKGCLWGRRTPIVLDSKAYEGGPTPLFQSPHRKFYIGFTAFNLIVFLVVIAYFIVQFKVNKVMEQGLCIPIDSIYIIVMIFCAINTLWYLFLARIETASD